ncbi:MAG: hypothetical protein JSU73_11840 [candidate division WOR-3 bacterium]|nr:MAG: hypothetical protein JSU73_11840 [candidate division WOR-3 bacterium]
MALIEPKKTLKAALADYDRNEARKSVEEGEKQRAEMLRRLPLEEWPNLPLERYAVGQENSADTFCRWLEFGSPHIGSIKGERGPTRLYVSRGRGAVSFVTSGMRISVRMYWDEYPNYRKAFSWDSPDSMGAQRNQLLDSPVRFPKTRKHAQNGE